MIKINKKDRSVLEKLYQSRGKLDNYRLFKRSMLSFSEFAASIVGLKSNELIEENADEIKILPKGKELMLSLSKEPIDNEVAWRKPPESFLSYSIGESECYVPSTERLSKEFFEQESKE